MVEVVSRKVKKVSKKRRREAKEGLFSGITYDPALDPRIRHYFDRRTGKISISSNAPSVKKYLGPNGEGQDYRHCQVLVAELVNDAVSRELARLKAERGALLPLGGDITAAVDKEIDQLVYKYAHMIHDILVDKPPANLHLHSQASIPIQGIHARGG